MTDHPDGTAQARVEIHLIDNDDPDQRITIPLGRIPQPADQPPHASDLIAVLQRALHHVQHQGRNQP